MAATSILTNLSRVILKSASVAPARTSSIRFISLSKAPSSVATASCFSLKRNINTQTQLQPKENPFIEERMEVDDMATLHQEAMDRWRDEAEKLRALMVMDDIVPNEGNDPSEVANDSAHQVKSLFQELIEEDLLDPRLLWTASGSANY